MRNSERFAQQLKDDMELGFRVAKDLDLENVRWTDTGCHSVADDQYYRAKNITDRISAETKRWIRRQEQVEVQQRIVDAWKKMEAK